MSSSYESRLGWTCNRPIYRVESNRWSFVDAVHEWSQCKYQGNKTSSALTQASFVTTPLISDFPGCNLGTFIPQLVHLPSSFSSRSSAFGFVDGRVPGRSGTDPVGRTRDPSRYSERVIYCREQREHALSVSHTDTSCRSSVICW